MTTITLKNIPDELYARLKRQAQTHRRSINSETLHCLESILRPKRITAEDRLARIRGLRARIGTQMLPPEDILDVIDEGRP